jgi:quercetin dioxygenase-like cupin family protein
MFEGFERIRIEVEGVSINAVRGSGQVHRLRPLLSGGSPGGDLLRAACVLEGRRDQMTSEPESNVSAAPDGFKRTELQRLPSPIPGWEIVQSLAEIPEGVASGRHSHPGPEIGYIVRGEVAMEFDDRPTLTLQTGDPFLIPPGVVHNARNIGKVTTKMLSTYVVDEAQPLATLFDG